MKSSLIYILSAIVVVSSCIKEQSNSIQPTPGEGVQFYASLDNVDTRTIYGDEVYNDNEVAEAIKVKWLDGDMISVYGATCSQKLGSYKVTAAINNSGNSYASNLEMIGENGVQWGTDNSRFYAIYPAISDESQISQENGKVVIHTSVRTEQKNVFTKQTKTIDGSTITTWVGTPYVDVTNNGITTKNRTMPDALMYASTDEVQNGSIVSLQFTPFSTVLKFCLKGWDSTLQLQDPSVYVKEIIVTAPTVIAGDCDFTFASNSKVPSAAPSEGNLSNTITIKPVLDGAEFLPLDRNEHFEFNVFTIPQQGKSLNEGWIVKLKTTHGNFQFTLNPTNADKAKLEPGKIHKINIPKLNVESRFTYEPDKWVESIPRNVYLSELSVPGAWYCGESGYQDDEIATQYRKGIRAFHIDCRASTSDRNTKYNGNNNDALRLVCAGTDYVDVNVIITGFHSGELVSNRIGEIVEAAKASGTFNNEYIVIVLTIAEQRFEYRNNVWGTIKPDVVIPMIAQMLSDNGKKWSVYGYTDDTLGKTINANTTLSDVLGKVIILVNANIKHADGYTDQERPLALSHTLINNYTTDNVPNALVTFGSMSYSGNAEANVEVGNFVSMNFVNMHWNIGYTNPFMAMCHHFAQHTDSSNAVNDGSDNIPSIGLREKIITDIVVTSQNNYYGADGTTNHNFWYQLGIGGYTGSGNSIKYTTVAEQLNSHTLDMINKKLSGATVNYNGTSLTLAPSPIGIVMMNKATNNNYRSLDLIQAIVDMNGKFRLNRDPSKEEWPSADINPSEDLSVGVDKWGTEML